MLKELEREIDNARTAEALARLDAAIQRLKESTAEVNTKRRALLRELEAKVERLLRGEELQQEH